MFKKHTLKYNFKYSLLTILINILFCLSLFPQETNNNKNIVKTVVIDPGHGGKDSGAPGVTSYEKHIVLAIALKLGAYIEEKLKDVKVIYTRKTDVFVELYKRAEIANENDADLFISIHANGFNKRGVYGTESLFLGEHRNEENFEVAKRENSVILFEEDYKTRYAGFDPESVESYIMLSLMQRVYRDHSILFAQNVQNQFRDRVKRHDRGVKPMGLLVLAQTAMPGALIEVGFVSNPEEEKFLLSEEGQDYIASAIFRAIRDYKEMIEANTINDQKEILASGNIINKNEEINDSLNFIEEINKEKGESIPNSEIVFKVQVSASKNPIPLNSDIFKDFNDLEEFIVKGHYKYAVGAKRTYEEIVPYSKWVKNRFPDAFIIAVKKGRLISLDKAIKETSK